MGYSKQQNLEEITVVDGEYNLHSPCQCTGSNGFVGIFMALSFHMLQMLVVGTIYNCYYEQVIIMLNNIDTIAIPVNS